MSSAPDAYSTAVPAASEAIGGDATESPAADGSARNATTGVSRVTTWKPSPRNSTAAIRAPLGETSGVCSAVRVAQTSPIAPVRTSPRYTIARPS